jgi:hypothetical protein
MGVSIMKDKEMEKFMDKSLQGQIRAIEHTFECVSEEKIQALQHPVNKSLKVAEVFPVYPDWDLWGTQYSHAVFDSLPVKKVCFMYYFIYMTTGR